MAETKPSQCSCESTKTWKISKTLLAGWLDESAQKQKQLIVNCVCNYLDYYASFAAEEKSSNEEVAALYHRTLELIDLAIIAQTQRISMLGDGIQQGIYPVPWGQEHILDPDLKNLEKLIRLAKTGRETPSEKTRRFDMVMTIENFVHMQHKNGNILSQACTLRHEGEAYLGSSELDSLAEEVLDCLAGEPPSPDIVIARLRGK